MKPKILLVGYNGANNTGAEAKLLAIIEDIRSVLGPDAIITVPSLNEANLRRYLKESPTLKIKSVRPSLFFWDAEKFVEKNDLIMIVEGSCYMDTWGSALLWYFLLATEYAHSMNKPCIAYAVDAGEASRFNRWLIRREASKTDLILTRTQAAANRLKNWGVTAPIEVTADNAFAFNPNSADEGLLKRLWPEASHVVGIAAEDVYLWPVVVRLWGHEKNCYRWPYYYSRSRGSCLKSEKLANTLASQADRIVEKYDKFVALLGMEGLDLPFVHKVQGLMKHSDRSKTFTANDYNASQMTSILRGLEILITSRYHAGVLSLERAIPHTAIGHDLRLRDLYGDLGVDEFFIDHEAPNISKALENNVDKLFAQYDSIKGKLQRGYKQYEKRAKRNPEILRSFIETHEPRWMT